MNRQKQILFGLLIILVLSGLYAFWSTPQQDQVAPSGEVVPVAGNSSQENTGSKRVDNAQKVNLELLAPGKKNYQGYKRDIFNFYQPKPVPKPVIKTDPTPRPVVRPDPTPKPAPVVTPQVRKQLATFTFLGFLVKGEERTVFLSKREDLFLVHKADFFGEEDQFEVVDITEQKLTINQQGASGLIEIPLIEKEPLIPSFSPGELSAPEEIAPDVSQPQTEPPDRIQVPLQEQRKSWFKNVQPPVNQ